MTDTTITKFKKGDTVYCEHKKHHYKARILNVQIEKNKTLYHIHYLSYNKKWDEWIPEERACPLDDEQIKTHKQKEQEDPSSIKTKKRRRRNEEELENAEDSSDNSESELSAPANELVLNIPELLLNILRKDYIHVT
ncbi:EAF3 [Acrasis kona]|uniref:EAF3 n=1 Tax=Acrasis kona TaxID=1008807 RepID=A0AAW2YJB4_9EUKA